MVVFLRTKHYRYYLEQGIINNFGNRSTNASAASFNAKKTSRDPFSGVNKEYFLYRLPHHEVTPKVNKC